MEKIFGEILSMSIDSAWLIIAVIIARFALQKAPMYFRKILWGLVGLRLVIPFSFQSALSLVPNNAPQTAERVAGQVVADNVAQGISFADVVPFLWTAVGIGFLIYGITSYVKLKVKISDSVLVENNIYHSDKIESPFVCGFIKPKIYLPYGLNEVTLNCVLEHEETHIKYADHIIKAISFVVLCVHWFNPLVWVAYFLLCKDIELSCDESVIKKYNGDECKQYAKALLELGVHNVKFTACPVAFGEVSIKKRIKSVISYKKASKILVVASLCLCVGVSVCFMTEPEVPLKQATVEKNEVTEETKEPETEKVKEPTTELTTEPATETTTEAVAGAPKEQSAEQAVTNNDKQSVEQTEEVFDDSMFENEDSGIENGTINRINVMEPGVVDEHDSISVYAGSSYNNFSSNSSVIGNKPSNTVDLPTVSFPADPTPTHNYGNTNHPHFEGNRWVYN